IPRSFPFGYKYCRVLPCVPSQASIDFWMDLVFCQEHASNNLDVLCKDQNHMKSFQVQTIDQISSLDREHNLQNVLNNLENSFYKHSKSLMNYYTHHDEQTSPQLKRTSQCQAS